ncbi:hypothetical protein AB0425_25575 [Actinosynnema sp. NPDC051121]
MPRNPLQPFTGFIRLLWAATTVASAVAVVLVAVASSGASVCVTSQSRTDLIRTVPHGDDAYLGAGSLRVCLRSLSGWERVLHLIDVALPLMSYAAVFFLLLRLLERGAVEGVHTVVTADRLRRLGWFTLTVVPLATLGGVAARIGLLTPVLPATDLWLLPYEWDVPWWAVVTGVGLLSLAKIMRTSAEMSADLEGTV